MSLDYDEKTEALFKALTELLNRMDQGIQEARDALMQFFGEKPLQKETSNVDVLTAEEVAKIFPTDLATLLTFENLTNEVRIKPRQYLGSDNFGKIAAIVKDKLSGSYVSAGKNSYFSVPAAILQPKAETKLPDFNTEDLMKHEWKAKRNQDGTYAKGSLSWGWDFADKFDKAVIEVLRKGPLEIDEYVFSLDGSGTLVQTKKKKAEKK